MKRLLAIGLLLYFSTVLSAQSFLDIAQVQFYQSSATERTGFNSFLTAKLNAGFPIGKNYWLLNWSGSIRQPQLEYRDVASPQVYENSLATGIYLLPEDRPWRLMVLGRFMLNGDYKASSLQNLQPAIYLLYQRNLQPGLQLSLGSYYAQQLFGPFYIPLIGATWNISDRSKLDLMIPSNGEFRYTLSTKQWYAGLWFDSNVQSFRLHETGPLHHFRLNEVYAGLFVEYNLSNGLVLRLEPLWTFQQEFILENKAKNELQRYDRQEKIYVRLGVRYRKWME